MSLVERALKKIQESRQGTPAHAAPVQPAAGSASNTIPLQSARAAVAQPQGPVSNAAPRVSAVPSPEPVRPSRVIHIDRDALRHAELLPPASQERQLAGEYRQIKRPLIANALGRGVEKLPNGHRIMIASAMPGDGKTFTSINLSLSFAQEKDLSVVLVDADVAKAHLSRTFGVHNEPGLMDLLRDEQLDVDSLILATDVPGLSILPAGKSTDNATELLASARMEQIANQISVRHPNRIALFDSPPLLITSEAMALSASVGQIVLVVRAGVTPQSAVLDAIELLGEGKSVGLVLNQTDEQVRPGYYYQYYGHKDGERTAEAGEGDDGALRRSVGDG
ncbi:AAA family ATPase [Steroidobacter sp.]|uniref:AAA family ATPase n=1 Tax=Steroidobacter sp. TaxID=1978227 RepID=UPI001A4A31E7|nr:AAA family ATPase [Steroidobacter sp.]MBL8266089.1 AAA family ATPase [Steroidobacter sp.]